MNAEQLNGLLTRLSETHRLQGVVKKLAAVRSSLDAIANTPGNAEPQSQFRQNLDAFLAAIRVDALTVFSVREAALLRELSVSSLTAPEIERAVMEALDGQDITPRVAHDAVGRLHDALQAKLNDIKIVSDGLTKLGIDTGEPFDGSVELGLFVPRPAEKNLNLARILEEGAELNRLVSAAYEVVEGKPESPPVRYLTSSDYGFLLEIAPQVVAFLVLAVERSFALYKSFLETQLLRQELTKRGADAKKVAGLDEDAKKQLEIEVHAEIKRAISERSPSLDEARKNELTNQVVAEVKIFLNKAEHGNYLDIRVGMEEEPQDNDPAEAAAARDRIKVLQEVASLARRLHALETAHADATQLPPPKKL